MEENKKNFKIIHVTSHYPPYLGGMGNCVEEISEIQSLKGYSVDVLTSNIGAGNRKQKINKLHRVFYLKSIELAHTPIIFSLFFKLFKVPKNSIIHLHVAHALTPEVVFLASKLRGIPYIAHIHLDVDPSGPFGFLLKPYKKFFLKPALQNAVKIICLSESQKDIISKKYDINNDKIIVLPNGVGEEFFIEREIRKKKVSTLLFVGRLAPQKNVPRLIEAIKLMKQNVKLRIVGEGEERGQIEHLIKELKLTNIELVGRKSGQKLVEEYRKADIFALPSDKEGMPLVLLEAMAAGLPIVASNIPGVNELIGDAGILVKDLTPSGFASALENLLIDNKLQEDLSLKSYHKAKGYSWELLVDKMGEIYMEVKNESK